MDWLRYEGGGTWSRLMTGTGGDSVRGREVKTAQVFLGSYTVYVVRLYKGYSKLKITAE